MSLARHF